MDIYDRKDLLFDDYEWTEPLTHVKLQGSPDRNMFNRNEGYNVLYIINYACGILNCKTKIEAGRMEILLHEKLPLEVKSQNSVSSWLINTYSATLSTKKIV
jgi:hypothetical protein